jgi:hypothetical protein
MVDGGEGNDGDLDGPVLAAQRRHAVEGDGVDLAHDGGGDSDGLHESTSSLGADARTAGGGSCSSLGLGDMR